WTKFTSLDACTHRWRWRGTRRVRPQGLCISTSRDGTASPRRRPGPKILRQPRRQVRDPCHRSMATTITSSRWCAA
ncbi:MAG: hypothetical protein AVDCRST_MAG91-2660, partial [uncultured Sphingomonadaceae bacterium]